MPTSSASKQSRVSATSSSSLSISSSSNSSGNNNYKNTKRIYWPNSQATPTETTNPTIRKIQIKRFNSNYKNNNTTTTTAAATTTTTGSSSKPEVSRYTKKSATRQATVAAPPPPPPKPTKYNKISHISPPTSLTPSSVALRNSIMVGCSEQPPAKQGPLSRLLGVASASVGAREIECDETPATEQQISGQSYHQHQHHHLQSSMAPYGPGSVAEFSPPPPPPQLGHKTNNRGQFAFLGGKSFLVGGENTSQFNLASNSNSSSSMSPRQPNKSHSQGSLLSQTTTEPSGSSNSSSTAQLQVVSGSGPPGKVAKSHIGRREQRKNPQNLHIGRRMDLKYIKSMLIILMAIDLVITIFVHQFATNDELNLSGSSPILTWLRPFKLRYSLINLILSSIWFIVLTGGILFDVYWILFCSLLVDVASFLVLMGLSIVHFTRRLDYNAVQLTSLLALLFAIVVLHVYLIVMAALTLYLMLAVRRRQRSRPTATGHPQHSPQTT